MSLTPFSPEFTDCGARLEVTPPLPADSSVGLRHFHAQDPSRDDVSTGTRQFMVSVFYPTEPGGAADPARLIDFLGPETDLALELLMKGTKLRAPVREAAFERLKSFTFRARRNAPPAAGPPCPVLIYYPGGLSHRLSNAALCEQFAAAGYIVLCLDAPRDAPLVAFPDGMLVPFIQSNEDYIWPRVADVRFLLDRLAATDGLAELIGTPDMDRIGMFGHSRGGYLSNICAAEDHRIRAAVNMDGFLWGLWTEGTGLSKYPAEFQARAKALKTPVLRLRGDQGGAEKARLGFEEELQDFGGDFIFIAIHGTDHGGFTTTPWINGKAKDFSKTVEQEPDGERAQLLMGLLTDFFDTYLMERRSQMDLVATGRPGMDIFARCGA